MQLLILSQTDQPSLGNIRCLPAIQAAMHQNQIYLQIPATLATHKSILQLPVQHSYRLDETQNLFPQNGLTPIGKLPGLTWQPIAEFIPIALPVAAMPGHLPAKINIRLVPSASTQESFALLTHLPTWKAWAETAPAVRLAPLQFALSATNQVLITGYPLPALPGNEYWLQHNALLPAGYAFEAAIIAEIIAKELNPDADAYLLFDAEKAWQQIPLNCFVPASRSAVRLTETVK